MIPASVREEYSRRLSFTCGRCDARSKLYSVRFAGVGVYLAVELMLRSPPGSALGQDLRDEFSFHSGHRPFESGGRERQDEPNSADIDVAD